MFHLGRRKQMTEKSDYDLPGPEEVERLRRALAKDEAQGTKFDAGKARTDLLPPDALFGVADVYAYGAAKYADRNWEKGMKWGRVAGAALRHLFSWMKGDDFDSESGLHHLAHFSCCALMLYALVLRNKGTDDRHG